MTEHLDCPCDGWIFPVAHSRAFYDYRHKPILSVEGFDYRETPIPFALLLPFVRTDYHRWSHDLDWTIECGPDDAPAALDVVVPYNYSGGCNDYFAGGCWHPGDAPEVETGTAWFINDHGQYCEVNLTSAEQQRVETFICENPPSFDYEEDWAA